MTDNEVTKIREKISCPQLGDDHYGEWGHLRLEQRRTIHRLLLEINRLQAEVKRLGNHLAMSKKEIKKYVTHYKMACTERNKILEQLKTANAKVERLQKENENFADIGKMYSEIKAEAYKEFFDLVHSEFKTISDYQYGKLNMTFCSNFQIAIDKLREIYRKLEGGTSV